MRDEREDGSKGKAGWLGGLGILGIIFLKFKFYIFAGLKALSFLKLGFLFKSAFSIFISIGVYWAFFGPAFAVIIVGLLIIHEAGHYVWMLACGLKPKPMMLIPLFGAYVEMTKMPADQATDAWVALAGPLVGGVASAGFYYYGVQTQNPFFMAAGSVGFFLNLLQLIPAKPLDGGFVINAVSKWLLIPGTGLLFALSLYLHSIMFMIICVLAFFNLIHQFRNPEELPMRGGQVQTPTNLPQKIAISIAYLGLAGMLGYLYWLSHDETISMLPAKHKQQAMKYHHSTPDHKAFSTDEDGSELGEPGVSEGSSGSDSAEK